MHPQRRILVLATIVLLLAAESAAQKRAITHEDVWLSRRLGSPVVSPDGRWAAVQVAEPAYDERDQVSDLWVVRTDGSTPARRLTSTRGTESGAAWSPDSRRLAFSARRDLDGASQIYVIDVALGGEAERVTNLSTGARTPVWRPDGDAILFVSDVYPGARSDEENKKIAAERRNRTWNARVFDTFPIRDWDRWFDERHPSLFVQPLEPGTAARDILAGSSLVSGPGFAGQWGSGNDAIAAAWTPDGRSVVFVATYANVVQPLWMVPTAGGEPARLSSQAGSYGGPVFSADGTDLFATFRPDTDRVYNLTRLVAWEWSALSTAGQPALRRGTPDAFDRSVGAYGTTADGRSVYFLAEEHGRQKLFVVPVAGGGVREVGSLTAGTLGALDVGRKADVLVATWESAVNPPELVRIAKDSGTRTALSSFNTERAASIDWQPLQEFWFTSTRGARIHNFVALPPAFDRSRKYPLLVLMHGGPHSMWIDQFVIRWNYHLLGQPGYVVLLTNYTGSTGSGEKFAQGMQGDPLERAALEINQAADEAIERFPFIDGSRQAAAGASYGGHLANWQAVTTKRYKALVSHARLFDQAQQWGTCDDLEPRAQRGRPPWEAAVVWSKQDPLARAGDLGTPMLVTVGERDYRVPMNNAIQLWSALQRMKVPSPHRLSGRESLGDAR